MKRSNRRGFTLLELTMAIAITSVIALSVAGVSMGLSRAYANSEGYYQTSQNARSAMMGVQSLLRKAKLVLSVSDDGVVFWAQDVNGDGRINRSEVTTLIYDKESRNFGRSSSASLPCTPRRSRFWTSTCPWGRRWSRRP
jgi:prepilin-type N-terminal cleavage/methylation domain-containing protein